MDDPLVSQLKWLKLRQGHDVYVDCSDGVMCVPITDQGHVIFITEPDAMKGDPVLFLPAGGIMDGESPIEAINRELQEEIGMKANYILPLGVIKPWSKYLNASIYLFLARDLMPSKLVGDEIILGEKHIPFTQFQELISSGELSDANVISALFLAWAAIERM
ncbi:MAG: NUDIX domain-containing protein [Anaerolineae bacterium]|nr:NUDIX domain-containing protein [Anaerolineae bacterium]MCA9888528.1 NUDIX domain-containing protein [Anaerolineae bacterium]MCA9892586.1 NUDIX domain-containing protein [Anaerolineae bacterium]